MNRHEARKPRRLAAALAVAAVVAQPALPAAAASQAAPAAGADAVVACTASSLTASPYDTVLIRVAADAPRARRAYHWSSTGGVLVDSGARALWRAGGAPTGLYTIEARLSVAGAPYGSCQARILVVPPREESRGGGDRVLRAGLTRGAREEPGWGRYNYLLLGSRPADSLQAARFRAVVTRFLARLDDIGDYLGAAEQGLAASDSSWRRGFAVTLIPLRTTAGPASDSVVAVMNDYDYPRAKLLLAALPGTHADGPYLVSAARPLSAGDVAPGDVLAVDLSHVSPALAAQWTNYFVQQATAEYARPGFDMRRGLLVMRTALAQLGAGTAEIGRGLATWRKVFDDAVSWTK